MDRDNDLLCKACRDWTDFSLAAAAKYGQASMAAQQRHTASGTQMLSVSQLRSPIFVLSCQKTKA